MTHHWGYVGTIYSAVLFGIGSTLNKIALENVHPLVIAGSIYLVGGLLLFGIHLSPLHKRFLTLFETPTETETTIIECYCRKKYQKCDGPIDVCLNLDKEAEDFIAKGLAKKVSLDKALEALKRSHECCASITPAA